MMAMLDSFKNFRWLHQKYCQNGYGEESFCDLSHRSIGVRNVYNIYGDLHIFMLNLLTSLCD